MRRDKPILPAGLDDDCPDQMPACHEDDELAPMLANPEDELFRCYGLRVNLPVRTKVEHLHLIYRLPVDQIASLLGISRDLVASEIEELKSDWRQMGKPLTMDDRELERGRLIASLDRLIQQIDDQLIGPGDNNRLLTLKLNALDRRVKLLGLEYDKSQTAQNENAEVDLLDSVDQRINNLTEDRLEELMHALDGEIAEHQLSGDLLSDLPEEEPSSSSSSSSESPAESDLANAIPGISPSSVGASWEADLD